MKLVLEKYDINTPTAVVAFTDSTATGAIHAITESELKIPDDISIIGYADVSFAGLIGLTTVRQPQEELGRQAAEIL
jgi:DNA-binding LacI/PurR family transcriptional regulator